MIEFVSFPKIPRLRKRMVVTEKIDGSNAQIYIRERQFEHVVADGGQHGFTEERQPLEFGFDTQVEKDGKTWYIRAGSRNRWLEQGGKGDNFGFGAWVYQHAHELVNLGPGKHFGEWWGKGIQRGYGLEDRRFSLFNVGRWYDPRNHEQTSLYYDANTNTVKLPPYPPACCHVVPTLFAGEFDTQAVEQVMLDLLRYGSAAQPGWTGQPEGVIVYLEAAGTYMKHLFDPNPKSAKD